MMPEGEEAPVICLGEPLAVFHSNVNSVVLAVEISASGWFATRTVRKLRIKNASQFLYDDRAFGKFTCLQICINVLLLNIDVMIFGKVRFSIIEAIGC